MQSRNSLDKMRSLVVVGMAVWLLVAVRSRPAMGAICLSPTNYLSTCNNYLLYGESFWLTWPFFPPFVENCCDKIAEAKLKFAQLPSTFDRQNLCECLRQECLNNKYYNWDRVESIPKECGMGPVGFTISRTVDCNQYV